jgi:O-succinylbenzoate-CoA ligase
MGFEGVDINNNFGCFLKKRAFLTPNREAYVDSSTGERLTFRELNERSNRIANALLKAGTKQGERVGILSRNSAEYVATYHALAKIGCVMVTLNIRLVADELEYILRDSGVTRLIFSEDQLPTVIELHNRSDGLHIKQWLILNENKKFPHFAESFFSFRDCCTIEEPQCRAGDNEPLLIVYTSGTTGLPKGVVHTHNSVIWATLNLAANSDFHDGDKYITALPMFHTGSLTPLSVNVYRGVTSVVMPSFDPEIAWKLIRSERITTGFLVPTMLNFMLKVADCDKKYDPPSLRWIMSGGSPLTLTTARTFDKLGIVILQAYGLTETCGMVSIMDSEMSLEKPDSIGKETSHADVRIVNDDGEICQPGVAGEIIVRGKCILSEYWNNPHATKEAIRDGWLHTGDAGIMDADGYMFIQDRIKNMIISGGENIYPAEIERVLQKHPKIAEAGVIGQESARWGESPLAIILRCDESLTKEEIRSYCREKLAAYKQPKGIEFVDSFPRNPMGKIQKILLKEQFPDTAYE